MKTTNLIGSALDWVVAKAEGMFDGNPPVDFTDQNDNFYEPSRNWAQGGPIIDREKIDLRSPRPSWDKWSAFRPKWAIGAGMYETHEQYGTTPLIAAMRCYVASKLGDEVELPEGLS